VTTTTTFDDDDDDQDDGWDRGAARTRVCCVYLTVLWFTLCVVRRCLAFLSIL